MLGARLDRLIHKLDAFTEPQRAAKEGVRKRIWMLYADLEGYACAPTPERTAELAARFDIIFTTTTGFVTLDRLLRRLHAKKNDLLMVLERPDVPLHTNGSENDIRAHVTRRKVSGGTRSDAGRDCRDAFLGLMKTCCPSRPSGSGTISAIGWASQAPPVCPTCPTSSAKPPSPDCPVFWRRQETGKE